MIELCKGCINYLNCILKGDFHLPFCRAYSSIMDFCQNLEGEENGTVEN